MVIEGDNYSPSIAKFLNRFSKHSKGLDDERLSYLENLFEAFLAACSQLEPKAFYGIETGRFNISFFEAVFRALCSNAFERKDLQIPEVVSEKLHALKADVEFVTATHSRTADTANVNLRFERAKAILLD